MITSIAVTGATGFLGRHLMAALSTQGLKGHAVVRDAPKWHRVAAERPAIDPGTSFAVADLADVGALTRAFEGVDVVIHNAALASPTRNDWDEDDQTNVVGTEHVIEAMSRAGIRRLLYISSIGAYKLTARHALGMKLVTEDDPIYPDTGERPQRNANRVTKALAEHRCRAAADQGRIDLTILRTSAMFGAHDPNVLPLLRSVFSKRVMLIPALKFPLAYAPDVAAGIATAVMRAETIGRIYHLAGPASYSTYDLVCAAREQARAKTRLIPIPLPIRLTFDNTRAARDLDFRNTPLDTALGQISAALVP